LTGSEIASRRDLLGALAAAAEIEHAAICQYLFAAFSAKRDPAEGGCTALQLERVREWQAGLLLVAREEMEHLGLVANLSTAVGGAPHFGRPGFPHRPAELPGITFQLERLTAPAVERFLALERSHAAAPAAAALGEFAGAGAGSVAGLYRAIRRGVERLDGERDDLWIGPPAAQVTNRTLDLRPGGYDLDLFAIVDAASAMRAIDHILEAGDRGESAAAPAPARASHADRFAVILREMAELSGADPGFEPARPVAANPATAPPSGAPAPGRTPITHPLARRAVALFNRAYEVMLLLLLRFHTPTDETAEEREGLKRIAFFPLMTMVLRPLGEILTRMPASPDGGPLAAGPSFELAGRLSVPPYKASAWVMFQEELEGLAADGAALEGDLAAGGDGLAADVRTRFGFLRQSLETLAANFARYLDLDRLRSGLLLDRLLGGGE
jgi:hypothetical protein